MLILFALILRGVSFEFRELSQNSSWKKIWDSTIFIGSFLPALLFGVAFANIFKGLPIDMNGVLQGNLLTLLNPYGLMGGVLFVLLFMQHGALWLCIRTGEDLQARAIRTCGILADLPWCSCRFCCCKLVLYESFCKLHEVSCSFCCTPACCGRFCPCPAFPCKGKLLQSLGHEFPWHCGNDLFRTHRAVPESFPLKSPFGLQPYGDERILQRVYPFNHAGCCHHFCSHCSGLSGLGLFPFPLQG